MYSGMLQELKRVATMGCYTDGDKPKLASQTLTQMEELASALSKKMFILGNDLCFLDFYLFELLQLVDFTTEGQVYESYPHLDLY